MLFLIWAKLFTFNLLIYTEVAFKLTPKFVHMSESESNKCFKQCDKGRRSRNVRYTLEKGHFRKVAFILGTNHNFEVDCKRDARCID